MQGGYAGVLADMYQHCFHSLIIIGGNEHDQLSVPMDAACKRMHASDMPSTLNPPATWSGSSCAQHSGGAELLRRRCLCNNRGWEGGKVIQRCPNSVATYATKPLTMVVNQLYRTMIIYISIAAACEVIPITSWKSPLACCFGNSRLKSHVRMPLSWTLLS